MLYKLGIIRAISRQIKRAEEETLADHAAGRTQQEPDFTSRLITRIQNAVRGQTTRGISWWAYTLTDRATGSQEHRFGADFAGLLEIRLPELTVVKGFLAQAKLLAGRGAMGPRDLAGLRDQCERMLRLSPDSYVFLYLPNGIRIVPAVTVASSLGDVQPTEFHSRSIRRFFEEHIECFIGDRAFAPGNRTFPDALEEVAQRYEARRVLWLMAKIGETPG